MAKKKWIQGAIKHPGEFSAKAKKAGKTTKEFAAEHSDDAGKLGKQARLAKTLMGMSKKKSEKKASRPTEKSTINKMYGSEK